MTLRITPACGVRERKVVEAADEKGAELTFGRSSQCNLVIRMPDTVERFFSRTHGRFYFDGTDWRVCRDGKSKLLMWLDFGARGIVTCHGRNSDLRLPVTDGTITIRPPETHVDLVLRWSRTDMPVVSTGINSLITEIPPPMLGQLVDSFPPRFSPFLLVLCHRSLLNIDGATPTIDQLALLMSDRRDQPIAAETVRKDYAGRLKEILRNHEGTETYRQFQQAEQNGRSRLHVDLSVLAADAMKLRMVDCDQLIEYLRLGLLPNFPDLGWTAGLRG